ncbi:MAG: hypothetical protein A2048_03820 [Deltaproteobacteria bacterium GWA2_45_12]|nr:MAG: hypothetical protein A2048_03820 [Deltaproteobacteria bacterium GWA2_45_12]
MYSKTMKNLIRFLTRFPRFMLTLLVFMSLIGGYYTLQLGIRSDFKALLPDSFESVVNLTKVDEYYGGISHLYVVLGGPNALQTEHFIDEVSPKLEKIPTINYVISKLPSDYFQKRLGLYISPDDLKEIDRRIQVSNANAKKGGSVFFSNMLDLVDPEDSAKLDFSDIEKKYENTFSNLWGTRTLTSNASGESTPRDRGYFYGAENNMYVVWIKSTTSFLDLDATQKLIGEVKQILDAVNQNQFGHSITYDFTGTYKTLLDQNQHLKKQILWVLIILFFLLGIVTALYYQNIIVSLIIAIPLAMALLWSGAITYFGIGHLNLISGFTGFIILGLGSDYGIYLLDRYLIERKHHPITEAMILAFSKTGRATLGSFLTTLMSFLALVGCQFKGFSEFGLIGAVGITATYLAVILGLPCLFMLMEDYHLFKHGKIPFRFPESITHFRFLLPFLKKPRPILLVSLGFLAFSLLVLPYKLKVEYQSNGIENHEITSYKLEKIVKKIVGQSLKPPVILVNSIGQEMETTAVLDTLIEKSPRKNILKNTLSLGTFIPKNQEEKRKVIYSILEHLKDSKAPLSGSVQNIIDDFKKIGLIQNITRDDLPPTIKKIFLPLKKEGDVYSAIYLLPDKINMGNKSDVELFTRLFKNIKLPQGKTVSASSESFILADILRLIEKEGPGIMLRMLLFFLAILYFDFRSMHKVAVIFIPIVATIPMLTGVMALVGINLNIINVCTIPIIFGVGIDAFIHYYHRFLEQKTSLKKVSEDIYPSIFFATFTSLIGFGGFAIASTPYIRSLGTLAIVGIIMLFAVVMIAFPAWIQLWHYKLQKNSE